MKRLLLPLIALSLVGTFPVRVDAQDRPARNEATEERKGKPRPEKPEKKEKRETTREKRAARPDPRHDRPGRQEERRESQQEERAHAERRAPEVLRERAEPREKRAAPGEKVPERAITRPAEPERRQREETRQEPRAREDREDDSARAIERRQAAVQSARREQQKQQARAEQLRRENRDRLDRARTARNTAEVRHLEQRVSTLERMEEAQDRRRESYRRALAERPRWSRGDRVPREYWRNYHRVDNWRIYGLRTPPQGYHWVRSDYNDFILVQIGGWVIADSRYRWDRDYYWRHRYDRIYSYDDDYFYRECRYSADPAGILAGAMIGGLIGGVASDGDAGGTIAGVILGGAAGAVMTRNLNCDDNSYAYRTYYVALNGGRSNANYEWHNPRTGTHGAFYVDNYYPDPDGFMCARYRQKTYVGGRRYSVDGNACRQPDGAWMFVD